MNNIALIPARSGSQRVPNKNIRTLKGKPLIAYTIEAALESNVYDRIVVITDSKDYEQLAVGLGAFSYGLRPQATSSSSSADIEWLRWVMEYLDSEYDLEMLNLHILRPTSPMRTSHTIRRALTQFSENYDAIDSLRAVEDVKQHPGKMWVKRGILINPLLPFNTEDGTPWHSSQKPALPCVYSQNASLEIVKASVVLGTNTISGHRIMPFFTKGLEGFDINEEIDFQLVQELM